MQEVLRIIDKVADTPSTVLITGESGTGKELVATRAPRGELAPKDKPLIRINCAAIPKDLMESELFGYEKGAFTGAVSSKPGRFELADGGHAVSRRDRRDAPSRCRSSSCACCRSREFERVGGIKTIKVDVRLITATNRDLHDGDRGRPLPRGPLSIG